MVSTLNLSPPPVLTQRVGDTGHHRLKAFSFIKDFLVMLSVPLQAVIIFPVMKIGKLKHKAEKLLGQGHTALLRLKFSQ